MSTSKHFLHPISTQTCLQNPTKSEQTSSQSFFKNIYMSKHFFSKQYTIMCTKSAKVTSVNQKKYTNTCIQGLQ